MDGLPLVLSDEFCDSYPHHIHPTPGYWIECSRAISNRGSAWTDNHDCGLGLGGSGLDLELAEVDEGITNSPDGSLRFWHARRMVQKGHCGNIYIVPLHTDRHLEEHSIFYPPAYT